MSRNHSKKSCWAALAVSVLLLGGCAEEREPINKVQANALDKTFFVGKKLADPGDDPEFYAAGTVVDVPFGTDSLGVFPGLVGGLKRVKFEILEDVLNVRMTYEDVEGVDGHGSRTTNSGRVIAAYRIESHFDIRRSYNPSTGEELNVIEENTSDRAWFERQYMRVDWSANLITTSMWWDPISQQSAFGDSLNAEPLAYYIDDPKHPDAPVFDTSTGYFDITNRLYVKPLQVTVFGQTLNACLYRGSIVVGASAPWGNCENSEITVRYSFRRLAQPGEQGHTDYEPIHWDGSRMNAFGVFTQDRLGWDGRYGIIDNKWYRFAQRYNIWQASHYAEHACNTLEQQQRGEDPRADADRDGTHDQCAGAGAGSRCDDLVGQCTIPYVKRDTRTVAWHYTVGPENDQLIYDWTERATEEWDAALRVSVQAARYTECVRTGTRSLADTRYINFMTDAADQVAAQCGAAFKISQADDAEIQNVRRVLSCWKEQGRGAPACEPDPTTVAAVPPMIVLCHNPVAASDDRACGEPGTAVRPGDLRYHHVAVWPTRHSLSPWGYGPSLADPLTGEIISGGINVYNAVTDASAQTFVDQLRWLSGELESSAITSGSYVRDWVSANDSTSTAATKTLAGGHLLPKAELDKRVAAVTGMDAATLRANSLKFRSMIDPKVHRETLKRDLFTHRLPVTASANNRAEFDARIALAKDSPIEAQLTNPMWAQMGGVPADQQLTGDALEHASPLRGLNSHAVREASHQLELQLAHMGQCMVGAPEPTGLPALARVMQAKFPAAPGEGAEAQRARIDKMWNYLRARMHYSVILHEMGHTVGLRHNFVGSYDKFNFRPQYWQLRTKNGAVTEPCTGPTPSGDCLGPRYWDALDNDEVEQSIWTWQHSTVMDYPGDLTQDMLGLGVYDYAAARMFYGDVVDVAADPALRANHVDGQGDTVPGTFLGEEVVNLVDFAGGLVGQTVQKDPSVYAHYSEWNNLFGLIRNCQSADTAPPPGWNADVDGAYDPVFDGRIVLGTKCDRMPVDYVQYSDLLPDRLEDQFGTDPRFFTARRARDAMGRPRMPYGFESDEYADGWSPSTYRHDNGADLYEELTFHTNLYENRHIFDNFRNGRVNFTVYGAFQRALSRYHFKISNLTQGVAYLTGFYLREWAKNMGMSYDVALSGNLGPTSPFYDAAIGAALGFDHFQRVLTRPHVGPHMMVDTDRDGVLDTAVPEEDLIRNPPRPSPTVLHMPNGTALSGDGQVTYGGRPLNNDFQFGNGYYAVDYLNQAGSYYEKTFAFEAMLAADYRSFNFWRFDGLDARFHHVNYADLYQDGIRRLIGGMLTGDAKLFAPRISASTASRPDVVEESGNYWPQSPLGWVSYINPAGPEVCWPQNGVLICSDALGVPLSPASSAPSVAVDPQLGFEVQKFIAFWAYVYLPGAQDNDWVDMMRVYVVGPDKDPDYLPAQRVEWRDPESGLRYVAKRYGDETVLGSTYDKGIAAKMLQWANKLTEAAYELDAVEPVDPVTGRVNVLLDAQGQPAVKGGVKCVDSRPCDDLRRYRGLLDFMRDTAARLGFPEPALQVYGGE